jgi:hypothetical protein
VCGAKDGTSPFHGSETNSLASAASGQACLDTAAISIAAAAAAAASELVWPLRQMLRTRQAKASEPLVAVLERDLLTCFVQQAFWKGGFVIFRRTICEFDISFSNG